MARRLVLLLVLGTACVAFLPASGALAGDIAGQKASVDAKLASVQAKLAADQKRADALNAQIGSLTANIHGLESRVGDVSGRLAVLRRDVTLHQRRLAKLDALFHLQTVRFRYLRREYALAVQRLDQRLVNIYKQGDPSTVDVLLEAKSFQDVLDQLDYLGAIATQDKHVALAVAASKHKVASARARTRAVRRTVRTEQQVILGRAQQEEILRAQLVSSQGQLAGAKSAKSNALAATKKQISEEVGESQALAAASSALAAKLVRHVGRVAGGSRRRAALHLAGLRTDHEPVRDALGHAASRHRHRRPERARPSTPPPPARSSGAAGCRATGTS